MSTCWAFHISGERCELDAGHDGDHSIVTTWADEDSWTPLSVPFLVEDEEAVEEEGEGFEVEAVDATALMVKPGVCFACGHPWHDEVCPVSAGEAMACGCMRAVA